MTNEEDRIKEAERVLEIDFSRYPQFKEITKLCSRLCNMPICFVTVLDRDTNWLTVASGINLKKVPIDKSFCQYGIAQDEILEIPDVTKDARFIDNPLVVQPPFIRFYAGAPLILNNGNHLGALCLFDKKPNNLSLTQKNLLTVLAKQIVLIIELELSRSALEKTVSEIKLKNDRLRNIAQLQSHEIRQPVSSILGLVKLVRDSGYEIDEEWLTMLETASNMLDDRIHGIVNETMGKEDLKLLKYNKMVEEIEDYAILLLDECGNIENWNKGAEKIKGYKAEEIVGKNFREFYTIDDRAAQLPERLLDQARSCNVVRDEGWRVKKDGLLFWARVVITAIHDSANQVIGFTKVTRDLTEQHTT
ncbi:PAS domain S-box protein [Niabella aquatica]